MANFCLYHDPCRSGDGFAAAMAVHIFLEGDVTLIPINYNAEIPALNYINAKVYIVDFCPAVIEQLYPILQVCKSLYIYDHHESAKESLNKLQEWVNLNNLTKRLKVIFDTQRSGARITWEALFNRKSIPEVIYHIDDYDRWIKQYPTTEAIVACIQTFPRTVDYWRDIVLEMATDVLAANGAMILQYQATLVAAIKPNHRLIVVMDTVVPIINCPDAIINEVLSELVILYPFAIGYFDTAKERKYSVRSRSATINTAQAVAELYGGGGHPKAAGFYTSLNSPIIGTSL